VLVKVIAITTAYITSALAQYRPMYSESFHDQNLLLD
jgi:hypothetical protein